MVQWMSGIAHFFMQYGAFGLFILSFVEASFFPVPPYLLSIPMTLAKPQLGFFYAFVGTIGSVLGGLFGYILGSRFGHPFLIKFFKPTTVKQMEAIYLRYGDWATAIGGLTPLPYKIFAIAAGAFRTRLATFIPASIFARGIRFFGEALLLVFYGKRIIGFLESTLGPVTLITFTILLAGIILLRRTRLVSTKLIPFLRRLCDQWFYWVAYIRRRFFPAGLFSWYLIAGATLTTFGLVLFSKIASELLEHELNHFDSVVSQWIITYRANWLTIVMQGITNLGSTMWITGLVLLLSILGFQYKKRRSVMYLAITIGGAMLLTELLKGTFQRSRPKLPWLTSASGYSFPSGHTLISFALYGFLAYLAFRNIKSKSVFSRVTLAILLILLPILIGISRIYLGVHYPSDVLAGWTVAIGWVGTCVTGVEYLERNSTKSPS